MNIQFRSSRRQVAPLSGSSVPGLNTSIKTRSAAVIRKYTSKTNSFIFFVALPSVLAFIYYFLIASSQFTSETRLIVRTIGVSEQFDTSEAREGRPIIGGDSLTQDSYIVANYLESPEIVRILRDDEGLQEIFSATNIDRLSRLPENASFERLHKFWKSQIDTYVDGPSGIIVFTVRAFSPEDSVRLQNAALKAATEMVDKLSERAKDDLVRRAESEVTKSLEEYRKALENLRDYQNASGILDPVSTAETASKTIAALTKEKLQVKIELQVQEAANALNSARGRQLQRQLQAIDEQIKVHQGSLAGRPNGQPQLSEQLTQFSQLETQRLVAEAIHEASVKNLDTARSTALRRTTFLSVFSSAQAPEKAEYPDRLASWILFSLGVLTLWTTITLVWMSIEDHRF